MTQRYIDPVSGSDSNTGTSVGSPWKTLGKLNTSGTSGDTVDVIGNGSESSPVDFPCGTDFFFGGKNNFTFRNYPDTHIRMSALGRGASHSGFTWERWTAGGITVQGTGSVRLGPMDANDPTGDGNWRFGVLQLTGSTGMLFDGGVNKKLFLNGGGCDNAIFMVNYNSSIVPADITVQNWEGSTDANAILIRNSSATDASPAVAGAITIQDFVDHDHQILLDGRGTSDTGATSITIEHHDGVTVRRGQMYNNYAVSPQYGYDGGAIVPFGCVNLVVEDCEMWDCASFIESGRGTGKPYCDNMIIRRNIFRGRSNPFNKNPPTDPSVLLRDFRDGIMEHNTFYVGGSGDLEYFEVALYVDTGTYAGLIDRAVIRNNIFVFGPTTSQGIFRTYALPTGGNAPTIDYNLYYRPNGGTVIGNTEASGDRTWAQWPAALAAAGVVGAEAHGINANPLLDGSYYLQVGSPAINAASDGTDMGALDYTPSNPSPGPSRPYAVARANKTARAVKTARTVLIAR